MIDLTMPAYLTKLGGVTPIRMTKGGKTYYYEFPSDTFFSFHQPWFLEKEGIKDVKTLIEFLNRVGYSDRILDFIPFLHYENEQWEIRTAYADQINEDSPIPQYKARLGPNTCDPTSFILVEPENLTLKNTFYDVGLDQGLPTIYYYSTPVGQGSGDDYLYRLNKWDFITRELKFLSNKKERTDQFFGLELELSTNLSPAEFQVIVTEVEPIQEPFFFFKHDSSVSGELDNNMELVTFPTSVKRLKKEFRILFSKIEKLCLKKNIPLSTVVDLTAHRSNGLHIHVSKKSFALSNGGSRLWLNKFASVWNQWDKSNSEFLTKLSGRSHTLSTNRYCSPHQNMVNKTLAYRLSQGALCSNGQERYASARETNQTIEVRIFQGVWDINHILYCVELTAAVQDFSSGMSIKDIGINFKTSFTKWLSQQNKYRYAKKGVEKCV